MTLKLDANCFFVFDLDDTLYPEIDFVRSGFKVISNYIENRTGKVTYDELCSLYQQKQNVFEWIIETFKREIPDCSLTILLNMYREHFPSIKLSDETNKFLKKLKKEKIKMGLITDGRS